MADSQINHEDARNYWQSIDADVNGMLGGFPYISRVDLTGSKNFLAKLGVGGRGKKKIERAVDCGAGIGRITEGLLLGISETVDIVEPIAKFSDELKGRGGVGQIFNMGLEDWSPSRSDDLKYDLIWAQWCLGHLTDTQLVVYLETCKEVLKDGGWIVVKENLSTAGEDVFDDVDSSVTRDVEKLRNLFTKAGLNCKRSELQRGLPKELLPVRSFALQPESAK